MAVMNYNNLPGNEHGPQSGLSAGKLRVRAVGQVEGVSTSLQLTRYAPNCDLSRNMRSCFATQLLCPSLPLALQNNSSAAQDKGRQGHHLCHTAISLWEIQIVSPCCGHVEKRSATLWANVYVIHEQQLEGGRQFLQTNNM